MVWTCKVLSSHTELYHSALACVCVFIHHKHQIFVIKHESVCSKSMRIDYCYLCPCCVQCCAHIDNNMVMINISHSLNYDVSIYTTAISPQSGC
jgi:hypothetical protein